MESVLEQKENQPQSAAAKTPESAEAEILKHLFESTVTFFRLINKSMLALGYSRQKRRQVFDSLIKRSTVDDKHVISGLIQELKPLFDELKVAAKSNETEGV